MVDAKARLEAARQMIEHRGGRRPRACCMVVTPGGSHSLKQG